MQNIIFGLASFLVAAFAFGYGAAKLFKKKKPLYLQILVSATGCFAVKKFVVGQFPTKGWRKEKRLCYAKCSPVKRER